MNWNRREMIGLMFAGGAGSLALRALPWRPMVETVVPQGLWTPAIRIFELLVEPADETQIGILRLGRPSVDGEDTVLLQMGLPPTTFGRWWATPGLELVATKAHPLTNLSSNVVIRGMQFEYRGHTFAYHAGGIVPLDTNWTTQAYAREAQALLEA